VSNVGLVSKFSYFCKVPFVLKAERNDFIHAFVAHFDVFFNHCHKPLGFSTGPQARTTHWKQAVFYLDRVRIFCCMKRNMTKDRNW